MRGSVLCVLLLAAAAGPLAAQGEPDSHPGAPLLRERIERRFAERVKAELNLTDEQAARLKSVAMEYGGRRKELRRRERELRGALDGQTRDGATADPDSVARLTRELLDLRVRYAESWRDEMKQLSFLTPVQRARLLVLRERLLQRVHEMRGDHRGFRHRRDGR
ncbi:MAG TPA: Spy/CpxP family protein refolding chaperone [Gemmatimonadales bacterium]|jgi:Spy/CpxP family protein refolding chaperone|nr:Spy/CpxP family protein refolding chaperone [Gemmatimonadales bacterium]